LVTYKTRLKLKWNKLQVEPYCINAIAVGKDELNGTLFDTEDDITARAQSQRRLTSPKNTDSPFTHGTILALLSLLYRKA
jgi:hypothetical protein